LFFPEISNVADMGRRSFRGVAREEKRWVSTSDQVSELCTHQPDLPCTLAGIFERAEDFQTRLSCLLTPKVFTGNLQRFNTEACHFIPLT
jgi:hypothetical protein